MQESTNSVAEALSRIDGVVAVGLGGSRGLGLSDQNSDFDFILFRETSDPISGQSIEAAIKHLSAQKECRASGNFIQAEISGRKIEVFQKDLSVVRHELRMAKEGKFRWTAHPLYPHGDLSTRQLAHLVSTQICSEVGAVISRLQEQALPLPSALKSALLRFFLKQASYSRTHAGKITKKDDLQNLMALVSGFIYFVNIAIFSLNDMYPILEKGGARIIATLPDRPKDYELVVEKLFRAGLEGNVDLLMRLTGGLLQTLEGRAQVALDAICKQN